MKYTELNIIIPPEFPDGREIAIALLDADNFDTFLETDTGIITYAESESFSIERLLENPLFSPHGEFRFRLITRLVPDKNWNKIWEESFLPVIIDNIVMVRAPFHEAIEGITHEIIIEPRMAFGTGHHETTELMIRQMIRQNFAGKRTLDMGCGTGILAIAASKLGSTEITAVDNDTNAVENCIYNLSVNGISNVSAVEGNSENIPLDGGRYDIILANITRNILIQSMAQFYRALEKNGVLILSGYYATDMQNVEESALACGFKPLSHMEKNNWVAAAFTKL